MDETIKIAELIDSYYPCIDGPINVVTNYCRHLNRTAQCSLLVPAAKRSQHYRDEQPFEVVRCRSMSAPESYRLGMPGSDGAFKRKVKEEKFDILHTHSPFSMGTYAINLGKKQHIPVVATLHTQYYKDFSRVLHGFKPLCNYMLHRIMRVYNAADSVWTVNNASCNILREYGYKGDIVVVRNGTDLVYPENAEELTARVDELHGLRSRENVLIFVGRVAMYKNLELMARALKIVKERGVPFTMFIVGSGFDEKKFKTLVEELGLADRFIFTGSVSDRTLLQGYYLRSDLFLFPSTFDTSSLVPIEAAAHKLPTLLIRGCCTAENITDGENGFLADESIEAYAERICELLSDPAAMRAVGERAHGSVYRTWENVAAEAFGNYKRILAQYGK